MCGALEALTPFHLPQHADKAPPGASGPPRSRLAARRRYGWRISSNKLTWYVTNLH
jgi:hypothetical protein